MKSRATGHTNPKILIAVFFSTIIVASLFALIGVDPHHDGILFKPAFDVLHGKMLFRDTFTQYGALTTLIQAFSLKLFGPYLAVIRLTTVLFYGLTSVVLFLIWSKFLSRKFVIISYIIWILIPPYFNVQFLPWSSVYALFFQASTLLLLLTYIENRNHPSRWIILFLVGISAALTFWCRQSVGGILFIALFIFFLASAVKKWLPSGQAILNFIVIAIGGIVISLPFLIWIIVNGAFTDWWLQSIILAFHFGVVSGSNYQALSILSHLFPVNEPFSIGLKVFYIVVPLSCVYITLKSFFSHSKTSKTRNVTLQLFATGIICIASWFQYYPVVDVRHTYWAMTPMIGLFIFVFISLTNNTHQLLRSRDTYSFKSILKLGIGIGILFLAIGSLTWKVATNIRDGGEKLQTQRVLISYPSVLAGMSESPQNKLFLEEIAHTLNDPPRYKQNPVINLSRDALYLTFTSRATTPHPMYVWWKDYTPLIYPDYNQDLDTYINLNHPIIISNPDRTIDGYRLLKEWKGKNIKIITPQNH